ncbi:MAG: DUF2064 domain-containing protein [Bdellovibrionota bacterium]
MNGNNSVTSAVAVFVKTPGKSPLKTRLAQGIGREDADRFYELSCSAIAELVGYYCKNIGQGLITPYWAIAEKEEVCGNYWKDFSHIWQGDGGLGNRLFKVYNELLCQHPHVFIIGSDCPQISPQSLQMAVELSHAESNFVMGEARDGGFWLVGGSKPIAQHCWERVTYSAQDTAYELCRQLEPLGEISKLKCYQDVDEKADLEVLRIELLANEQRLAMQDYLLKWLSQFD